MQISRIEAREVLDCRGLPTLEVDVHLDSGEFGRVSVPAGRSTSHHEATDLRDGGKRFGGFGVRKAIASVREHIAPALKGLSPMPQRAIDAALLALDPTSNKSQLGGNAVVGVSLACARAAAKALGQPLYGYLNADAHVIPVPQVNLINGGRHASNDLDFQEFIIMPVGAGDLLEALQIATEINLVLFEHIVKRYGKIAANVGDEGGFAPPISEPAEALELLHKAVGAAGHSSVVAYGLDCAATHLYDQKTKTYAIAGRRYEREKLIDLYRQLIKDYGVVTIEDPLHDDDFEGFAQATRELGIQIVGDDLFATNAVRVAKGVEQGAANALLWKVNQIGTLSEARDAANLARANGYSLVPSERSGETEDDLLADLCVALNAGQIKTGAPVRGERTSKYNRLLRIAEELGSVAVYPGRSYRLAGTGHPSL